MFHPIKHFKRLAFTPFKALQNPFRCFNSSVQKKPEIQAFNESFLSGTNSAYIEQIFDNWILDKSSVHSSWDAYFTNVLKDHCLLLATQNASDTPCLRFTCCTNPSKPNATHVISFSSDNWFEANSKENSTVSIRQWNSSFRAYDPRISV